MSQYSSSKIETLHYIAGGLCALLGLIAGETLVIGCGTGESSPPGFLGYAVGGGAAAGTGETGAAANALAGGAGGAVKGSEVAGGSAAKAGTGARGGAGGSGKAGGGRKSGSAGAPPAGACSMSAERVRLTEVDVASAVLSGDTEQFASSNGAQLTPVIAISPIASGGSRLAWVSGDNKVHIGELDAEDQLVGTPFTLPAHDFSDIYADDKGGVVLLTRDAKGGGTLNCGNINNLCGNSASYPTTYACYDMYMVRFDGSKETWATKLTDSSASHPPYGSSPTDNVMNTFVWAWYGHHGRIAFDGSRWGAYYGVSISGSSQAISPSKTCAQADSTLSVGIDIHQGDQMRIVDGSGAVQTGGFQTGCSHSYYERIVYDPTAKKFVQICETDRDNTLSFAPPSYMGSTKIYDIDMQREIGNYSNIGNIVTGSEGGYWVTASKSRASAAGMADVHLLHFTTGAPDKDIVISNSTTLNCRSNHLGKYGSSRLVAAWETASTANDFSSGSWLNTSGRKFYVQTHSAATGEAEGGPYEVSLNGNRYYEFRDYPDGSVAYPTLGSANTKIKIMRVLPCGS